MAACKAGHPKSENEWTVYYNRDSGLWSELPEPVTLENLHDFLDPILERCDVYLLDPGAWAQFWPSRTRDMFAADESLWKKFRKSGTISDDRKEEFEQTKQKFEQLLHHTDNPVASVLSRCKNKGVRAGLSIRMNDRHVSDIKDEEGRIVRHFEHHVKDTAFRRDHPEYRFGRYDGLNFALQPVRDECFTHLQEICGMFVMDILELDFLRLTPFFPDDVGKSKRFRAMNDLIKKVYGLCRDLRVELQVRVPPTVGLCEKNGLDIRTWMDKGWITTLIASPIYSMEFNLPLSEFRECAGGQHIPVIPGIEKCIMPYGLPRRYLTQEMLRACIAHYYREENADGIYFFNLFGLPGGTQAAKEEEGIPPGYGKELGVLEEAMDPESTLGREKTYVFPPTCEQDPFASSVLPTALPATFGKGEELAVSFPIADQPSQAKPDRMVLKLQIKGLEMVDPEAITIRINDSRITDAPRSVEEGYQEWMNESVKKNEKGYIENEAYLVPHLVVETPAGCWEYGSNTIGISCPTMNEGELELRQIELDVLYE